MNVPALSLRDVRLSVQPHFWSQKRTILQGVSMQVQPGTIVGFLGPNGAGKTSTIKVVLGLTKPDQGQVEIFGGPITDPAVRRRIGFMPERPYFSEHLTGLEVVYQHAQLAGIPRSQARARSLEMIRLVGLESAQHQRLGGYSKGMLQRVGMAQAMVGDPDLVILDEPLSGLDPGGRRDLRDLMLSLRAQGKTVFFSTHILPDVELICDRVAILVQGQVRRVGRIDDLIADAHRVSGVEIIADTCPEALVESARTLCAGAEVHGNKVHFAAADLADANALVDHLRAGGARVVSMSPERPSLEQVFLRETQSQPEARE